MKASDGILETLRDRQFAATMSYIYHDSDNGKTVKKTTMMTITVTMRTSPRTRNSLTKRFRFFIVFISFIV
jgi:hypothetical protein